MGARVGRTGEHRAELAAGGPSRSGDISGVQDVERTLDRPEDLPAAGLVHAELAHELVEDLEVLDELPDLLVEDRQVGS